jgi:hypothetical protein
VTGHRTSQLASVLQPRALYLDALSKAEQIVFAHALEIEGLEEEIAILRTKLHTAMDEKPEDYELMMKGISLLIRAVATRHRLSKQSAGDLANSLSAVIEQVGALGRRPDDV